MRISSALLCSQATAPAVTAAAMMIILLASNVTIINAQQQQQQQQLPASQPPLVTQNGTTGTLFESTADNFRVQVPQGWIIYDVNNTGPTLGAEISQGYGILAQLCPQVGQQAAQAPSNIGNNNSRSSCGGDQREVIHILRYPNLTARFAFENGNTPTHVSLNDMLTYQIQKFQEVGYRNITIVNSTASTINLHIGTGGMNNSNNTVTAFPVSAILTEITYSTNLAPNEIRR